MSTDNTMRSDVFSRNTAINVLLFSTILTGFSTITYRLNDKLDKTQELVFGLDKAMAVAKQESKQLKSENESLQKQVDAILEEQRYERRNTSGR
ncbi:hypothetical protein BCU45_019225 [Vibrio lentus]|uniref:hypothetical protein n=1 Tax=Vibrio lentus TaxID=136468 RepID=UPI000C867839|nr:hypothetical protein [Vibrio lentus]PMI38326.1 hypothetical protein BCU45_06950 [Vibrio lentus]PMJ58689.1 hypothetical protein BCU20_12900 [Vibrio lentus]